VTQTYARKPRGLLHRFYCPACGDVRTLGPREVRITAHSRQTAAGGTTCPGGTPDKTKDAAP
jgi:hypothetical protein